MRLHQLLPIVSVASAFVITEYSVHEVFNKLEKSGQQVLDTTKNVIDEAIGKASATIKDAGEATYHRIHQAGYDVDSWLEGSPFDDGFVGLEEDPDHPDHPPHHGKPDHPPHHGKPDHPPHHGKPHHPPHHGHDKPNHTVYELISKSKYTTKLIKLIDEYPDIVKMLNCTKSNYTFFAPTDSAFDKIPEHHHKPSKEFLKNLLLYHVADDFYPAGRVLHSYTIPTLYKPGSGLGHHQRLTVRVTLRGPAINFYSRLVATNIFATNGVIHGVDSILIPPPSVSSIINLLPGEFSTLELGLQKTGLYEKMNSTKYPHEGGTLFAPSNWAFKKLGPRVNAFLFSSYGEKYLKALLEYHMVVNQTLYSDAYFDSGSKSDVDEADRPPYYHYDLPTVLGKNLAVDIARYGPFVEIKVNAFSRVTVHDGVASDGVIQVVSNVLIPPKNAGDKDFWAGEEMSVEEFKGRLEPFIEENMEL